MKYNEGMDAASEYKLIPHFGLSEGERLKGKKAAAEIFKKGKPYFVYPIKAFVLFEEGQSADTMPKLMVAVPKKAFKKAVDRNALKRKMREGYRLNKYLLKQTDKPLLPSGLALLYVGKDPMDTHKLHRKLQELLKKISAT